MSKEQELARLREKYNELRLRQSHLGDIESPTLADLEDILRLNKEVDKLGNQINSLLGFKAVVLNSRVVVRLIADGIPAIFFFAEFKAGEYLFPSQPWYLQLLIGYMFWQLISTGLWEGTMTLIHKIYGSEERKNL